MLKKLPISYIPKITLLINSIFKFYFYLYWKISATTLILKKLEAPPPPADLTSYHPISPINFLSKLTEAFITCQLNTHIQDNNIISALQLVSGWGFPPRIKFMGYSSILPQAIFLKNSRVRSS